MSAFYVIKFENGATCHGTFKSYEDAAKFAEIVSGGYSYKITEYDTDDDYFNNIQ